MNAGDAAPDHPRANALALRSWVFAAGAAFLILMPLTSFPWFPSILRTIVAPASLYPLAVLVGAGVVAWSFRARTSLTTVTALTALALALSGNLLVSLNQANAASVDTGAVVYRWLRAVLSIAMACGFLLGGFVFAGWHRRSPIVVVRSMIVALVVAAPFAFLGIATMLSIPGARSAYSLAREITATSGATPIGDLQRFVALTFEPSFAALELTTWWLPFTIGGFLTTRKVRYAAASILLLVLAVATQAITAVAGVLGLAVTAVLIEGRRVSRAGISASIGIVCVGILALTWLETSAAAERNPVTGRVATEVRRAIDGSLFERGPSDGSLAVRSALGHTALRVWASTPVFGAGLGSSGYLFGSHVPEWAYRNNSLAEYWAYVDNPQGKIFPSAKNLYLRIASDAGIVGLAAFMATFVAIVVKIARMRRHELDRNASQETQLQGARSWLATSALLASGGAAFAYFSVDSFALPFLWVWWGLALGTRRSLGAGDA